MANIEVRVKHSNTQFFRLVDGIKANGRHGHRPRTNLETQSLGEAVVECGRQTLPFVIEAAVKSGIHELKAYIIHSNGNRYYDSNIHPLSINSYLQRYGRPELCAKNTTKRPLREFKDPQVSPIIDDTSDVQRNLFEMSLGELHPDVRQGLTFVLTVFDWVVNEGILKKEGKRIDPWEVVSFQERSGKFRGSREAFIETRPNLSKLNELIPGSAQHAYQQVIKTHENDYPQESKDQVVFDFWALCDFVVSDPTVSQKLIEVAHATTSSEY